ncbi:M23 family metallopeptidase [Effusibacillus pohliae]|uniref:M23 family metallopeptidase n=1 Tax=Effusibacillus pohliae TaxID=232270 RepID=UPI0003A20B18|nr:M23 family metallopeptidase [Effusibacillus pohliae]
MNQENKQTQNMAPRSQKKPGFWRTLFAKRWTFPAIYLGAAALIIGLVVAQVKDVKLKDAQPAPNNTGSAVTDPGKLPDSAPATAGQKLIWPVSADDTEAKVTMAFYDPSKDEKTQAASILKYDNNFYTQNGVVIGRKDDKPFTVVAAASGTVTRVEADPLMGQVVEIKHDNGYVTYYASLDKVEVKEGDKVNQGQPIAKSGNNKLEADQKNHLHFEVKKDGKNVNPETEIQH